MTKQDVEAELERQRALLEALTPQESEAKAAEAEKRIATMDDDELMDELCRRSPRPNADDLIGRGLMWDEATKASPPSPHNAGDRRRLDCQVG